MSYVPKILIVDDEPRMCDSLKVLLGSEGYEIQTRHNGQEALEALAKNDFDLVLLDLVLPDINGAEIMDHINSQTPETFVIVITGHASLDSAVDSVKKGAFDYLRKPFEHEELSKTVKNALDQKALKSERKRAEEALRKSEGKLNAMLQSIGDHMSMMDKELNIIWANETAKQVFGNDIIGKKCFEAYHRRKEPCEPYPCLTLKAFQDGKAHEHDTQVLAADGKIMHFHCTSNVALRDKEEKPTAVIEISRDTTERRRAEEALRESEKRWRDSFNSLEDIMLIVDKDYTINKMNDKGLKLFGKTEEEVIGDKCYRVVHGMDRPGEFCPFRETLKSGKPVLAVDRYEKAFNKYFSVKSSPIFNELGEIVGFVDLIRDITERKLAEEALRESEEKYRSLVESTEDSIYLVDRDCRYLFMNEKHLSMFDLPIEKVLGRTYGEFHSEEETKDFLKRVEEVVETGKSLWYEYRSKRDGRYFLRTLSPVKEQDGRATAVTIVSKNITEQKKIEEERSKLKAQLQQAQKMEAIGTLAGGIAHDFNNLLMGVQGNVSLMLLNMDTTHPYYERLKSIEKQVQSGAKLTSHLLGYARKGRYEVKPIDLNQLVDETSETFSRTKKGITIRRELAEDLFAIEADQGQIEQVLLNLFVNGADAMSGGGDLILKTMNTTHDDMKGKLYNPKPGNYVLLTVTDTGIGMDRDIMKRIFDPFFTTKEMGRGTGLGLASAYGITKGHGGYIEVDSKKGQGTTFSIYLPASEKRVEKAIKTAVEVIKGTGTVLLADDEEVILEVGQALLEAMGYRVLIARDGKETIEVYEKNRDDVDIVVLDMVMPNIGGGEAYDRMKEISPDIKVLLSSGYSIDGEATEILERGCDGFIQKPFNIKELSGKIREVLDKK